MNIEVLDLFSFSIYSPHSLIYRWTDTLFNVSGTFSTIFVVQYNNEQLVCI